MTAIHRPYREDALRRHGVSRNFCGQFMTMKKQNKDQPSIKVRTEQKEYVNAYIFAGNFDGFVISYILRGKGRR